MEIVKGVVNVFWYNNNAGHAAIFAERLKGIHNCAYTNPFGIIFQPTLNCSVRRNRYIFALTFANLLFLTTKKKKQKNFSCTLLLFITVRAFYTHL